MLSYWAQKGQQRSKTLWSIVCLQRLPCDFEIRILFANNILFFQVVCIFCRNAYVRVPAQQQIPVRSSVALRHSIAWHGITVAICESMAGVGGKRRLLSGGTEFLAISGIIYLYTRYIISLVWVRIVIFSMVATVSAWDWGRGFYSSSGWVSLLMLTCFWLENLNIRFVERFGLWNVIFDLEIWWVFSFYMRFRFGLQSLIRGHYDIAIYQPCAIVPCHAQGMGDISMVVYHEKGECWLYSRIRRRWSILY